MSRHFSDHAFEPSKRDSDGGQPDVQGYFIEYGFPPGLAPGHANVTVEYAGRPLGHDSRPLTITRIAYVCMCPAAQFGVQSLDCEMPVAVVVLFPHPDQANFDDEKFPSAHANRTPDGRT
jgi:hypothetical protein